MRLPQIQKLSERFDTIKQAEKFIKRNGLQKYEVILIWEENIT